MVRASQGALVAAVALVVTASVAVAAVPDPTQSTVEGDLIVGNARGGALFRPGGVNFPGVPSTIADGTGFYVIVRDVLGTPIAGATVTLSFGSTGVQPHATQTNGQVSSCTGHVLSAVTDGSGRVEFFPATVGINHTADDVTPNIQIRANAVLLATVRFRSTDLSCGGSPGCVNLFDAQEFRLRFLPGYPTSQGSECDYAPIGNHDPNRGVVDNYDANVFRTEFLCGFPVQAQCASAPVVCSQSQCAPCP